uniref:Uncharacterized protein n=1 Tax=Beihai levi-like virus 7 TaxID=1922425 RepID=A0A1L3KI64_9VIRU|nr:hypothetical protein [Beihai levi-like virus 7]
MLENTLSINYGAAAVTLTRVNQDNYASTYFGEEGQQKFTMNVKHTIPDRGLPGESHLVRLDVEHYDTNGVYLRTSSAWTVIKTFDSTQDSTACSDTVAALQDFTGVPANIDRVIAQES